LARCLSSVKFSFYALGFFLLANASPLFFFFSAPWGSFPEGGANPFPPLFPWRLHNLLVAYFLPCLIPRFFGSPCPRWLWSPPDLPFQLPPDFVSLPVRVLTSSLLLRFVFNHFCTITFESRFPSSMFSPNSLPFPRIFFPRNLIPDSFFFFVRLSLRLERFSFVFFERFVVE